MMVEVPSAVMMIDHFVEEVDFLSIGTNDLIQYTLAVDRGNKEVANLYNASDPAMLRLIDMTLKAANRAGVPANMCGQMSGSTTYTQLLIGLGLRHFSVAARRASGNQAGGAAIDRRRLRADRRAGDEHGKRSNHQQLFARGIETNAPCQTPVMTCRRQFVVETRETLDDRSAKRVPTAVSRIQLRRILTEIYPFFPELILPRFGSADGKRTYGATTRANPLSRSKTIFAGSVTAIWCEPGSVCCVARRCRWA